MSIQTAGRIPEWTRGDRLRKARQTLNLNSRDFAELLGVSQATITNAENDKHSVRRITIKAWAMATGVPESWLETGEVPPPPDRPKDLTLEKGRLARIVTLRPRLRAA